MDFIYQDQQECISNYKGSGIHIGEFMQHCSAEEILHYIQSGTRYEMHYSKLALADSPELVIEITALCFQRLCKELTCLIRVEKSISTFIVSDFGVEQLKNALLLVEDGGYQTFVSRDKLTKASILRMGSGEYAVMFSCLVLPKTLNFSTNPIFPECSLDESK